MKTEKKEECHELDPLCPLLRSRSLAPTPLEVELVSMGFRIGEAFSTKGAPKATAQSAAGSSSVIDLTGDDDSPAPKRQRPSSHPPGTFAPGTELVLHGLERRPALNGATVRV